MARVIVVGAGVIGLSVAVRLLEDGHRVDLVARDLPLETTSAVAGAFWYPYLAAPRDRVGDWAARSFARFERLAADHPDSGVRMVAGTELCRDDPGAIGEIWWARAVPALRRSTAVPPPYAVGLEFATPVAEMPVYLAWLARRVTALGGTLTRMALAALPTHADVVVDASGLGARLLAGDRAVTPVRGQVVRLGQVGLDRWWLDSGGDGRPATYVVPRAGDIVVGGTEEPGEWNLAPSPETARDILDRAAALVPALAGAPVLGHRVGLRPARTQVRLEAVDAPTGGRVVHCYGHGGAGMTLSWGCAEEVADLVRHTSA